MYRGEGQCSSPVAIAANTTQSQSTSPPDESDAISGEMRPEVRQEGHMALPLELVRPRTPCQPHATGLRREIPGDPGQQRGTWP